MCVLGEMGNLTERSNGVSVIHGHEKSEMLSKTNYIVKRFTGT